MKNNSKGTWSIFVIAIVCIGMIYFFSTLKQNDRVRINVNQDSSDYGVEDDDPEEENVKKVYAYPYYGMSEEDLNHCLLGKPMIISECSNFDKRAPKDKSKYYYFGYGSGKNSGKIIVKYWRSSEGDSGYVEYPSENGYVDSGYYVGQDGTEFQFDRHGVSKVERETEDTTEYSEKKNGGRLLPGSKDTGTGPSSKTTNGKGSTSATTQFDPDDHDIEGYYEDNKEEYDSIDDAYDGFEDDPDAWDDY